MSEQSRWTGRITAEIAAKIIGCSDHDIPVLVKYGLLPLLGHPEQTAVKYFAASVVADLANDPKWLSKVTDTSYRHWRGKNANRKNQGKEGA
jgi:hypothetical protein